MSTPAWILLFEAFAWIAYFMLTVNRPKVKHVPMPLSIPYQKAYFLGQSGILVRQPLAVVTITAV